MPVPPSARRSDRRNGATTARAGACLAAATSNAKAEQFTKQPLQVAHHAITTAMTQPGLLTPEFIDRMWAAIDEDITLSEWCVADAGAARGDRVGFRR